MILTESVFCFVRCIALAFMRRICDVVPVCVVVLPCHGHVRAQQEGDGEADVPARYLPDQDVKKSISTNGNLVRQFPVQYSVSFVLLVAGHQMRDRDDVVVNHRKIQSRRIDLRSHDDIDVFTGWQRRRRIF